MSLFPAYATDNACENIIPQETQNLDYDVSCLEGELNEPDDIRYPITANSEDETELLETSESSSDEASNRKRKHDYSPEHVPKKKKKHKHKKEKKDKRDVVYARNDDEFYVDKKPDPGYIPISTLYYPARPEYHQSKIGICITMSEHKKSKKRWKRYYEVDVRFINEKNYNTEKEVENSEKNLGDYEKITDSNRRWDDSRTEKDLTDKTAEYNKYLSENPCDVDKWLEFVRFQENRYSYDVLNYRATNESSAREVCRQKQLSIIDVALSHNPKSKQLMDAKLQLARLLKPSPEYLSILKDVIAAETDTNIIARLWCALAEGVFGSAALCSAVSVRDSYTAALKATRRNQKAYMEMFYRYGLFLRHAGLLEQLNLLLDLVTAMNFSQKTSAFESESHEKIMEREKKLADEESVITSSGLPLSLIWSRVEALRGAAHWRVEPHGDSVADPQRTPDPSDVADMISPVTARTELFLLPVHLLRLLRVPLFPMDGCMGALLRSLHSLTGSQPQWDWDSSEGLLPLLMETSKPSEYRKIVASHAAMPNFFQHGDYLNFVEKLFAACLDWTSGRERLAVLIWWIRFQTALLSLNTENRSEAARVRKQLQHTLKQHATSPLAFAQFARIESVACGRERGAYVAVTAFRSANAESRADRLAIARCVCELSLDRNAASWTLVCASLGRSLPLHFDTPPSRELLQESYNECEQRCRALWEQAGDDYKDYEVVECMLPSDDSEWWLCRYEILARLQPGSDMPEQREELLALAKQALTPRRMRMHEAGSSSVVSHCGKERVRSARALLDFHPENTALCVAAGTRPAMPTLPPPPPPSTAAAIAAVLPLLLQCEETDAYTPSVGCDRRALHALRKATAPGAPGARSPLLWRLRLDAETRLHGGNPKTALYLALDECPAAKDLYVEGAKAAPSEFAELTDLLLEKQLRLHALPDELEPL